MFKGILQYQKSSKKNNGKNNVMKSLLQKKYLYLTHLQNKTKIISSISFIKKKTKFVECTSHLSLSW